jgi:hypothetical protein
MDKKVWTTPALNVFGTVEELTEKTEVKTPGPGDDFSNNIS